MSILSAQFRRIAKAAYNRLAQRVPHKLHCVDAPIVEVAKQRFVHSEREFVHGRRRYIVDSLYCHAVPGTFEICLVELQALRNERVSGGSRLLNVGGGTGQVSTVLAELGFDVFNIDVAVNTEDERNIRFDLNKDEALPFPPGYFDVIFCEEVIEHIENPWKLFRLVAQCLKKEGKFFLTTPNIQSRYSKALFIKRNYFHWFTPDCFSYHINPLPLWEIEMIARQTGFALEKLKGNGNYYFRLGESCRKEEIIDDNETLIFVFERT